MMDVIKRVEQDKMTGLIENSNFVRLAKSFIKSAKSKNSKQNSKKREKLKK